MSYATSSPSSSRSSSPSSSPSTSRSSSPFASPLSTRPPSPTNAFVANTANTYPTGAESPSLVPHRARLGERRRPERYRGREPSPEPADVEPIDYSEMLKQKLPKEQQTETNISLANEFVNGPSTAVEPDQEKYMYGLIAQIPNRKHKTVMSTWRPLFTDNSNNKSPKEPALECLVRSNRPDLLSYQGWYGVAASVAAQTSYFKAKGDVVSSRPMSPIEVEESKRSGFARSGLPGQNYLSLEPNTPAQTERGKMVLIPAEDWDVYCPLTDEMIRKNIDDSGAPTGRSYLSPLSSVAQSVIAPLHRMASKSASAISSGVASIKAAVGSQSSRRDGRIGREA
ncbi:hypothetical protein CI109_102517 [Kwoniella shandongensis]|uniref:Uncharacterized protein n=1 Tax=Kwoniella shandongensis TaxID=1734106 RepID=A0A5M6BZH9_9TREE|nr:uncharacterized protein CI109_003165 [Kwoniella shandongensis]KAA5528267.1 hypothetical protein CI109_003165 [Kwoniella shandongensis]